MSAKFDMDEAIDNLAAVTRWNDESGRLTLYAVVCGEHGGIIVPTAAKAIEGATDANGGPGGCVYRPLALTMDPRALPEFPQLSGTEDA